MFVRSKVAKFIKFAIYSISIIVGVSSCGGTGICAPSNNLQLSLTAPYEYPANLPNSINAQLTIYNDSNFDAINLTYNIPDSYNYTGVPIMISNDSNVNPCVTRIRAKSSCTFTATISAYANPGSFRVVANYGSIGAKTQSQSLLSNLVGGGSLQLTANIGLTEINANSSSGANGITFIYPPIVAAPSDPTQPIFIPVVAYVNSASAGVFNQIKLTDQNGNPLTFTVTGGSSCESCGAIAQGSIVQFMLQLPPGTVNYQFYGQTVNQSTVVDTGTTQHPIQVTSSGLGALQVQPTEFTLLGESVQTITYTNVGSGNVTDFSFEQLPPDFTLVSNNCPSTLQPKEFCTYTIKNKAGVESSGTTSIVAKYSGGQTPNQPITSTVNYRGPDAQYGAVLSDISGIMPAFSFSVNTVNHVESRLIRLTNTGNTSESNFLLSLPASYFKIEAASGSGACNLSGSPLGTVTNVLAIGESCVFNMVYDNSNATPTSTGDLQISSLNYGVNGNHVSPGLSPVVVTYQTLQAYASLSISSGFESSNPQTLGQIIANGRESSLYTFTVTNNGPDSAESISFGSFTNSAYTIESQTCTTSTPLAAGSTCTVTVKFKTTTVASPSLGTLPINYTSTTAQSAIFTSYVYTTGSAVPAHSPQIVIESSIVFNNSAGGDGTNGSKFAVSENSATLANTYMVLTYTNIGQYAAKSFVIESGSIPQGYQYASSQQPNACAYNGVTPFDLESNATNSCTVTLQLTSNTATEYDINLNNSLTASWVDSDSYAWSSQSVYWYHNNATPLLQTIYTFVYANPVITVTDNLNAGRYLEPVC